MARRCAVRAHAAPGRTFTTRSMVADRLGIAHYVLDYESRFRDRRDRPVRRRICAWPHARPLLAVQPGREVHRPDRLRPRARRAIASPPAIMCAASSPTAGPSFTRAPTRGATRAIFSTARPRDQLDFLRFPLGDLPKSEVRKIAADLGLEVAAKPDSQDICFVPDGDYAGLGQAAPPRDGSAR